MEHRILSAAVAALLLYCAGIIIYRIYFHPLAKYPGPFLAKFTDFHSFAGVLNENRSLKQYEFLRKYGSPVRFSTNQLVFSDLASVNDIYGQSSSLPPKDRAIFDALSATGEKNILNMADRHAHGRVRRLVSHGFSLNRLLASEDLIQAKVEQYITAVFRGKENTVIDIYRRTHELSLDIVSLLAFAKSFDTLAGKNTTALRDVEVFGEVVPPQAFFPGFRYLPLKSIQEGFRGLARLEQFARRSVENYVTMKDAEKSSYSKSSLLSNLIEAQDAETGTTMTEKEIVENTIIFLVAGSSTTAITATYLLWECGRRPEVMHNLVKEIREAFPDPRIVPTYSEASKLKYLGQVMDEVLRLWGPLNSDTPRTSPGKYVGGHFIPQGVNMNHLTYASARDPHIFPEPDSFDPARWEDATKEMRLMSRPFSIGPRNCVGRHMAEISLYLSVTRIFQLYDLELDPSMTEETMAVRDRGVFTPKGEKLLVIPRPATNT